MANLNNTGIKKIIHSDNIFIPIYGAIESACDSEDFSKKDRECAEVVFNALPASPYMDIIEEMMEILDEL